MEDARPEYPKRPAFFAHKVVRLLWKSNAYQDISLSGCWLVATVAHIEDELRYGMPARFGNPELCRHLGMTRQGLLKLRQKCESGGWLHVWKESPQSKVCYYWVDIPEGLEVLDSVPMTIAQEVENAKLQLSAKNLPTTTVDGVVVGPVVGPVVTFYSYPNPNPEEEMSTSLLSVTPKRRRTQPAFSDSDFELASWIWDRISDRLPKAKKPSLPSWANDVRLMVERDKRTHAEIRDLYAWANQHHFWWKNVLCPGKLRTNFDRLEADRQSEKATGNGRSHRNNGGRVMQLGPGQCFDPEDGGTPGDM